MKEWYVYLAGPITGLSFKGCTEWRSYVTEQFPPHIIGVSPLRSKDYLQRKRIIKDAYSEHVLSTGKAITCRDHMDVRRCDLLFANLLGAKTVSIGTVMEIAWADSYRKPIVVVMEKSNIHQHSMIREVTGFLLNDLDQAISIASAILSPTSITNGGV